MQVVHRLVGYDRQNDRMKVRFDIPQKRLEDAKRVALVAEDDPDAAWSYALSGDQARAVAALIGAEIDPATAEFFLEAFAVA